MNVGSYVYRVAAENSHGHRGWAASKPVTVLCPPRSTLTLNAPSISSTSSYTVSWGEDVNADDYQLQERKEGDTSWSPQYEGADRSTVVSGVTNGAHYSYQVRARNAAGWGPFSAVKTVAIAIPPPAPTGVYTNDLTINAKMEVRTVVWNASSGATYYKVKDVTTGVVREVTATSLEVEGGYNVPVLLHDYAVSACNPWACSAFVSAPARTVYNPPSYAPTLSAPSGSSSGSYTVSWGSVSQASSYTLQESANGGTWKTVYSGSGRSKGFSHGDGSYRYRVRASNSGGIGPWSGTKTVQVAKPPAVPTGLSLSVSGPSYRTVVAVSWNAASGATSYQLEETHPQEGVSTSTGTSTSVSSLIYADGSLKYRVRACNAVGCSAWSSSKSVWLSSL